MQGQFPQIGSNNQIFCSAQAARNQQNYFYKQTNKICLDLTLQTNTSSNLIFQIQPIMIKSNFKQKKQSINLKRSLPSSQLSSLQMYQQKGQKHKQFPEQPGFNDKLLNIEINLNQKLNFLRKDKIFYLQKLNRLQDSITNQSILSHTSNEQNEGQNRQIAHQQQHQNYLRQLLNQSHILQEQLNIIQNNASHNRPLDQDSNISHNMVNQIVYLKYTNLMMQRQIIQEIIDEKSLEQFHAPKSEEQIDKKIQYLQRQIQQFQKNQKNMNQSLVNKYRKLKNQEFDFKQKENLQRFSQNKQIQQQIQQIQGVVNEFESFLRQEQENKQKLFQQIYQKKIELQNTKRQNLVISSILSKILSQPIHS